MIRPTALLLGLVISLAPGLLDARPGCFGSAESRKENAASRQRVLDFVDEDEGGVTVAHASLTWEEPRLLRLSGIELLRIKPASATIAVSKIKGCAGSHALRVDDALPGGIRVLALLPRWSGVLLERRGELLYLRTRGARLPRWLMAWRVDGSLPPDIPSTPWSPPPEPPPEHHPY
jgi:hypothetical protein